MIPITCLFSFLEKTKIIELLNNEVNEDIIEVRSTWGTYGLF